MHGPTNAKIVQLISIYGSNQDLLITGQEADNRLSSGKMFTECFTAMYTAYLPATGQTRATPNILYYIRHRSQTPCTSGLIAVVILFNRIILSLSNQLPREIRAAVCV